jgi:signal transduction histidine kinase
MNTPIRECLRGITWEELLGDGKVVSRDVEVFYPQHRYVNFYIEPMRLEKPAAKRATEEYECEPVGFAVILRDITENRRSTEETIHSERLSALTLLAAGVAHEIGNPLNSLNIHLQLLERKLKRVDDPLRRELKDVVDIARGEIERLDSIVQQFLGAIRPAQLELGLENLNTLIRETVDFLHSEITDREIRVEQRLRKDLPLAEVDKTQIKQAFFNVIKNAVQAMRPGGVLKIESTQENQFIRLTFKDTGGGISPTHMSKIFDPYFTTKKSGSGLGLLIVRRIVREHGGEIDLVSHDGEGLEFTIRLPLRDQRARLLPPSSS